MEENLKIKAELDKHEQIFGEKLKDVEYIDRIGVYGIAFDKRGRVGIIKTLTGFFLPGGGIENNETHKECMQREFLEETGYKVSIKKYIGKASKYHYSDTLKYYMHGIGYFYVVNLESKCTDEVEKDYELLWLHPNECIKCLFLEHQAWAVLEAWKRVN